MKSKYKNEVEVHGKIDKSKPIVNLPYQYPTPFNIDIKDIPETQTGSLNKIKKFNSQNSNLVINDIPGTKTSSKKKGITTTRQTNPLNPVYSILGGKELLNENNNPFGTTFNAKSLKKKEFNNSCVSDFKADRVEEIHRVEQPNYENNYREEVMSRQSECNYSNANGEENFDPRFSRPEPYYGFLHDKYIIQSDTTGKNSKEANKKEIGLKKGTNSNSNTLTNKISHNRSKSNGFNKTNSNNFGNAGRTFAQKLDSFIEK